jgi:hypothetical protein
MSRALVNRSNLFKKVADRASAVRPGRCRTSTQNYATSVRSLVYYSRIVSLFDAVVRADVSVFYPLKAKCLPGPL